MAVVTAAQHGVVACRPAVATRSCQSIQVPPFNLGHAANVITRALIPIFGVAFLGWSGTKLLVVYFADTLASLYALMTLVLYAETAAAAEHRPLREDGLTPGQRIRTGIRVAVGAVPFLLIVGFFFGVLPLFVMLDQQDVAWGELLADRNLWIAVACQFAGAVTLLMNQLDWVRTLNDPRGFFRHQLGLLATRWGAMILVGFFLSPVIPRLIYGWLLIVTYAVATAALELAPGPVLTMVARWTGGGEITRRDKPPVRTK